MKLRSRWMIIALAAAPLASTLPLLGAATATAAPAAAPAAASSVLTGYTQKRGPQVSVAPSSQVRATVSCPRGTNVVGGGALLTGSRSTDGLNSSNPNFDNRTWVVRVNNSDETQFAQFTPYAVCASGIQNYQIIEGIGVDNPGGTQATAQASCPADTTLLGGGGNLTSPQLSSYLNSTRPANNSWRVTAANANPADDNFVMPYAICGQRPAGYTRITGTPSTLKPNSQGQAAAGCPKRTTVLSGGGQSSSTSQSMTMNSSAPSSNRVWQIFENNVSAASKLTAYAICAQTSQAT